MKLFQGINIPIAWSGIRKDVQDDAMVRNGELTKAIEDGFAVTHVTSSTVNNVMYVYHFLEKEVEK